MRYLSTDASAWACERWGHERRDISAGARAAASTSWSARGSSSTSTTRPRPRALENLAAASRGLLYLEAVTRHDLEEVVDAARTDTAIHAREGAWYRRRLAPQFRQVGAGLWASRAAGLAFYELEAAGE